MLLLKGNSQTMQQEMQQPLPPSGGYEGEQTRSPGTYYAYAQKLSAPVSSQTPTAGQRLALAIVSLSLLIVLIFGLTILAMAGHVADWAVIPILFIILLFSAVAVVINVVFNRRF